MPPVPGARMTARRTEDEQASDTQKEGLDSGREPAWDISGGNGSRERLTRQQDQQAGKTGSLPNPGRSILYDNPGFQVQASRHHATAKAQVSQAIGQGVEIWQVNFHLDNIGVRVLNHHELTQQFSA